MRSYNGYQLKGKLLQDHYKIVMLYSLECWTIKYIRIYKTSIAETRMFKEDK